MNKSELFKSAHKLAKSVIKAGDNYRVTFGACIKAVKEGFNTMSENTISANLKHWNKNGENRVYINFVDSNDDAGFMNLVGHEMSSMYVWINPCLYKQRMARYKKQDNGHRMSYH